MELIKKGVLEVSAHTPMYNPDILSPDIQGKTYLVQLLTVFLRQEATRRQDHQLCGILKENQPLDLE